MIHAISIYLIIGVLFAIVVAGNLHKKDKPLGYIIIVSIATIPFWLPGVLFAIGEISAENEQKRKEFENKFRRTLK